MTFMLQNLVIVVSDRHPSAPREDFNKMQKEKNLIRERVTHNYLFAIK